MDCIWSCRGIKVSNHILFILGAKVVSRTCLITEIRKFSFVFIPVTYTQTKGMTGLHKKQKQKRVVKDVGRYVFIITLW